MNFFFVRLFLLLLSVLRGVGGKVNMYVTEARNVLYFIFALRKCLSLFFIIELRISDLLGLIFFFFFDTFIDKLSSCNRKQVTTQKKKKKCSSL